TMGFMKRLLPQPAPGNGLVKRRCPFVSLMRIIIPMPLSLLFRLQMPVLFAISLRRQIPATRSAARPFRFTHHLVSLDPAPPQTSLDTAHAQDDRPVCHLRDKHTHESEDDSDDHVLGFVANYLPHTFPRLFGGPGTSQT